jgi:hypothetical protein
MMPALYMHACVCAYVSMHACMHACRRACLCVCRRAISVQEYSSCSMYMHVCVHVYACVYVERIMSAPLYSTAHARIRSRCPCGAPKTCYIHTRQEINLCTHRFAITLRSLRIFLVRQRLVALRLESLGLLHFL